MYPLAALHFLQVIESIRSYRWLWSLTKKECHYRSFYKRYNAPMVEVWQYLEIQQGWWIRSRGAGEVGAREGGSRHLKSTPDQEPLDHNVIPALPKVARLHFSRYPAPPTPNTVLTLLWSRHPVQLRDGSGWQRGRGRLGCGRGVSVRHSSAGLWVRGVGAERSREIKSRPKREEGKRGWGGGGVPLP